MVFNLCMNMPCFEAAQHVDDIEIRFRRFIVDYNRTYTGNSTEYARRLAIFVVSSDQSRRKFQNGNSRESMVRKIPGGN